MKKTKLLLKTFLVAVWLCMGSMNLWGEEVLFSENFNNAETPAVAGWTITGGTGTIETSADASIGKYAKFVPSSTSGNRGQSYGFSDAHVTSAGNCWKVEFDAALTPGADRTESSIAVTGAKTGNITTNNAASGALYFLCKQSANNSSDYNVYIGNSGDAASANYSLTAGTFYHFIITYDGTKVTAKVGDYDAICKNVSSSETGALKGLKTCESRAAGIVSIDNIKLSALVAPAFTLSEDSKTVTVNDSETISVTDITGSITVSSNNTAAATASYNAGIITINGVSNGIATITVTGTNDGLTLDKTINVTVGAVSKTTVIVNYLCDNTPIANPLELTDVAIGSLLTTNEVLYDAVIYGTDCRYINPVLSKSLPYTVVENGVINITYTQQDAVASLKIKAKVSSTNYDIKTVTLTDKYIGDVITITYPSLWLVGSTLYSTAQNAHNDGYYKWNYTLNGDDVVIDYNTMVANNVVYYSEGENISGMTSDASNNADIRCSDGKGGRSAEELLLTTLGTGVYKLNSRVWGNKGVTYTYRAAGADVLAHELTGALNDKSAYFSVVSETADIKIQGSNTNGKVVDYVYIQKIADADAPIFNGDFSNTTWNAGWNGTGSDKAADFIGQESEESGFSGKFAEMWTDVNFTDEGYIYQTLINVPAGSYTLSANIKNTVSEGETVLYAKVGNANEVTTDANNLTTKTEKKVDFTVNALSNVIIGYKTINITNKKGWIAIDDFSLTALSSELALAKSALNSEIEEATAVMNAWEPKIGTVPFKYASTYYDVLVSELNEATAVKNSESETVNDYTDAKDELEAAKENMANSVMNLPDADKYYRLFLADEGVSTGKNINMLIYGSGNTVISTTPYPIKFVVSGNNYIIENPYDYYIATSREGNGNWGAYISLTENSESSITAEEKTSSMYIGANLWSIDLQADGTIKILSAQDTWKGWNWCLGTWSTAEGAKIAPYDGAATPKEAPYNTWLCSEPIDVTSVSLAVNGEAKWGTFIAPYDNIIPEGVKAYTIAGKNKAGTSVSLEENVAGVLSANTPYFLSADATVNSTFTGIAINNKDYYTVNGLTGLLTTSEVPAESYVLQYNDGVVALYQTESAITGTANRCFVNLANVPVANEAREGIFFNIFGGEVTGISASVKNNEEIIFNLSGQRVSQPKKGLYIVNGKKVIK